MKKYIFTTIFSLVTLFAAYSQNDTDTSFLHKVSTWHLFENRLINVDLKFIDPEKGNFGIDYGFNLSKNIGKSDDNPTKRIDLNLKSKGFVTVTGRNTAQNSIVNELGLVANGFPIGIKGSDIPFETIPFPEAEANPDLISLSSQRASQINSPLWMYADIHLKHETTQDFKDYDIAFGGYLAFSSSLLTGLLDMPFSIFRVSKNNKPRQLDLSIGIDYVTGLENTANATLRDDDNDANRINFKGEWETGIFKNERISFLFDSYYELDAPEMIKVADLDFNYFFQIKLEHILLVKNNSTSKLAIKYTQGELPPNFETGYVIGGGFSIEF